MHHFICTKFLMLRRCNGIDFRGRRVFIMKLNVCPKNAACADGEKSCQLWKLVSIVKGVYSQSYPQTNAIRLHFYIVAEKGCLWGYSSLALQKCKKQNISGPTFSIQQEFMTSTVVGNCFGELPSCSFHLLLQLVRRLCAQVVFCHGIFGAPNH